MDHEFQTWAIIHKISLVDHWIWAFIHLGPNKDHEGFNHWTLGFNPTGSCEPQASGLGIDSKERAM
jgi:hypothetical protein